MQTTHSENRTGVQLSPAIASMLERADNLFAEKYWAEMTAPNRVKVTPFAQPGRFVRTYEINLDNWTCQCESFHGGKLRTRDGCRTCKHLAGVFILAHECEVYLRGYYQDVLNDLLCTADGYERRGIHMGCSLVMTFGATERNKTADNSKRQADAMDAMLARYRPAAGRKTGQSGEQKAA